LYTHILGIVGGFMHGLGAILSLLAGYRLTETISVSILRCHPLVVALWGVLKWNELAGARCGTGILFACMLIMFSIAATMFLVAGLMNQ
jgi:hypothetical protein